LLQEVDYGRYEGLSSRQIHESDPGREVYKDGCPGGETPEQIYKRAQEFIELVARHADARLMTFAHGHILRAIAVAWIRAEIRVAAGLQLDVATLNILRDAEHGRVVALWNAPEGSLCLPSQGPGPAAHAWQSHEHKVCRRGRIGAIGVPLARVDEQHLAGPNL